MEEGHDANAEVRGAAGGAVDLRSRSDRRMRRRSPTASSSSSCRFRRAAPLMFWDAFSRRRCPTSSASRSSVENHGGAGGTIGTDFASRQPADGYTIVLMQRARAGVEQEALSDDQVRSGARASRPSVRWVQLSYVLVVNPKPPRHGSRRLCSSLMRSPGTSSTTRRAGVGTRAASRDGAVPARRRRERDARALPGSAPALTGVAAGDTQLAIDNVAAVPLHQGRARLRALCADWQGALRASSPTCRRSPRPACRQFDVTATWGLLAPAGVPAPIVAKLNDALVRAVNDPSTARIAAGARHHA